MDISAFSKLHPAVLFCFYALVIVFSALFAHPLFALASFLGALLTLLSLEKSKLVKILCYLLPLMFMLCVLNPLFSSNGQSVLFTYANNRSYTVEALLYGALIALQLGSLILWFASFSMLMSQDKLLCLFGAKLPAISMLLSMALRMVPLYGRRLQELRQARASIGLSFKGSSSKRLSFKGFSFKGFSLKRRLSSAMLLFMTLVNWAFESGLTTIDSMRSRAYGSGKTTHFSLFRFKLQDAVVLVILFLCAFAVGLGFASGACFVQFYPSFMLSPPLPLYVLSFVAYILLLSMPFCLNLKESLACRLSLSKI